MQVTKRCLKDKISGVLNRESKGNEKWNFKDYDPETRQEIKTGSGRNSLWTLTQFPFKSFSISLHFVDRFMSLGIFISRFFSFLFHLAFSLTAFYCFRGWKSSFTCIIHHLPYTFECQVDCLQAENVDLNEHSSTTFVKQSFSVGQF